MSGLVQVTVSQIGPTTSEGHAREHSVVVDRPEAKGGDNRGPMGGEYLLIGLGGCYMSNVLAAIAAREADVSNVRITVSAVLEDRPPRFSGIEMVVDADYKDRELMQRLMDVSERACISANTLRSGTDLVVRLAEA